MAIWWKNIMKLMNAWIPMTNAFTMLMILSVCIQWPAFSHNETNLLQFFNRAHAKQLAIYLRTRTDRLKSETAAETCQAFLTCASAQRHFCVACTSWIFDWSDRLAVNVIACQLTSETHGRACRRHCSQRITLNWRNDVGKRAFNRMALSFLRIIRK